MPYLLNHDWLPVLFKVLIDTPVLIISWKNLLRLPQNPDLVHPMWRNIDTVVFHLAGSSQKAMEFQSRLKTYRKHHHDRQQGKDILGMYSDSRNIVISRIQSLSGNHQNTYMCLTGYFHTGLGYYNINYH